MNAEVPGSEIRGSRVRLATRTTMETHAQLRAAEDVSVRDYYINLLLDAQKGLRKVLDPIRSSGQKAHEGFIGKLEAFAKDLDTHIEELKTTPVNQLNAEEKKLADAIMEAKPLSVNAPPPQLPVEKKQEVADAQKAAGPTGTGTTAAGGTTNAK